jgi:hypothetical protein
VFCISNSKQGHNRRTRQTIDENGDPSVKNVTANDNNLAPPPSMQQKIDGMPAGRHADPATASRTAAAGQTVDLGRGSRRLTNELRGTSDSPIASHTAARALAGDLAAQLGADPASGLQAHARLDTKLFAAATAPPSA